jgi:hypothetical protein
MGNDNDIRVGEDKWISWVDFSPEIIPIEIDNLLMPAKDFLSALETDCSALCCGVHAFNLEPENLKKVSSLYNTDQLKIDLLEAKLQLLQMKNEVVVCSLMNQLFNRVVFIQMLEHVIDSL